MTALDLPKRSFVPSQPAVAGDSHKAWGGASAEPQDRSEKYPKPATGWEQLGVEIAQAIIWACLARSILLADVANNWVEMRAALTASIPVRVPAKPNLTDAVVETT